MSAYDDYAQTFESEAMIDLGGGTAVPLSELVNQDYDFDLDDTSWPTPDEERRVSQFDTVEEERGER